MFLIDTVTLSELRKRERDPMVVKWIERQRTTDLFLSVISIGAGGGTVPCAACALAGCDTDESGGDTLAQPATASASQGAIRFSLVLMFMVWCFRDGARVRRVLPTAGRGEIGDDESARPLCSSIPPRPSETTPAIARPAQ